MTDSPLSGRILACPACGKATVFAPSNRWRPFCSERCRTTDLGAWATESYRIPEKPAEDEDGGPPGEPEA
ncbi:MAG TPA: DNA gyrase inhibitor YacG [Usitatibacter sp.]